MSKILNLIMLFILTLTGCKSKEISITDYLPANELITTLKVTFSNRDIELELETSLIDEIYFVITNSIPYEKEIKQKDYLEYMSSPANFLLILYIGQESVFSLESEGFYFNLNDEIYFTTITQSYKRWILLNSIYKYNEKIYKGTYIKKKLTSTQLPY